jgi:hypothetical protein
MPSALAFLAFARTVALSTQLVPFSSEFVLLVLEMGFFFFEDAESRFVLFPG